MESGVVQTDAEYKRMPQVLVLNASEDVLKLGGCQPAEPMRIRIRSHQRYET